MATYMSLDDRSKRGLTLLVPPTNEPVSVAQAKLHLRIDDTQDDAYVAGLIQTARQHVENVTRRALYRQQWQLTLDRFPVWNDVDGPYFWLYRRGVVQIVKPPMMSLASIQYMDTSGVLQTVDPSTYMVDVQNIYARVQPLYGQLWPISNLTQVATVHLLHWSGYTDGIALPNPPQGYQPPAPPAPDPTQPQDGDPLGKVPGPIKSSILVIVGWLYEHRGATLDDLPKGIMRLLAPYRNIRFGT